jgi:hypothetical protein
LIFYNAVPHQVSIRYAGHFFGARHFFAYFWRHSVFQELLKMANKLKVITGVLVFVSLVAFGSLYSEIPYTVAGKGILLPEKEWKLIKTADGTVLNILKNNSTNSVPHYTSTEFNRGDHVVYNIQKSFKSNDVISEGDTIGQFASHQEQLKLLELEKELIEQKNIKSINLAGEKPERTRAALEELKMAETDFEAEKRLFERSRQLYEMDVIPQQEYEEAENIYNLKKQNVNVAKANYQDLLTGSKKEEIELVDATIEHLQKQIDITQDRINALTILSPVSGIFAMNYQPSIDGEEILARVIKTSNMALMMPVEISQLAYLTEGSPVKISSPIIDEELTGTVSHIDNNVESLDGRQTVFITCLFMNENNHLLPNLKVEGTIICENLSLWRFLKRLVRTIYTN